MLFFFSRISFVDFLHCHSANVSASNFFESIEFYSDVLAMKSLVPLEATTSKLLALPISGLFNFLLATHFLIHVNRLIVMGYSVSL